MPPVTTILHTFFPEDSVPDFHEQIVCGILPAIFVTCLSAVFFCWVLILKPRPKRSRGSHLSLEAIRDLDALRVAFGEASEGGANAAETNAALDALAKRLEEVISATGLGESWCTNKCT